MFRFFICVRVLCSVFGEGYLLGPRISWRKSKNICETHLLFRIWLWAALLRDIKSPQGFHDSRQPCDDVKIHDGGTRKELPILLWPSLQYFADTEFLKKEIWKFKALWTFQFPRNFIFRVNSKNLRKVPGQQGAFLKNQVFLLECFQASSSDNIKEPNGQGFNDCNILERSRSPAERFPLIFNETTYLLAPRMELPGQHLRNKAVKRWISKVKDG